MNDYIIAINDKRPEQTGFRVFAYLTVAHPGIEPVLTQPATGQTGKFEVLQLDYLESGAPTLQVAARKVCVFERNCTSSSTLLVLNTQGGQYRMPIITVE